MCESAFIHHLSSQNKVLWKRMWLHGTVSSRITVLLYLLLKLPYIDTYQNGCIAIVTFTPCCNTSPFGMVGKQLVFDMDAYWQCHEFLWFFHPKMLSVSVILAECHYYFLRIQWKDRWWVTVFY
jgi:hypothetical protein